MKTSEYSEKYGGNGDKESSIAVYQSIPADMKEEFKTWQKMSTP